VDLLQYFDEHKCGGVATVGFCWGGWATCYIAADFALHVKCQAIAHPSIENMEKMLGGDHVALCKRVKCPTLLMPGSNDDNTYRTSGVILTTLQENNSASKSSEHIFDSVKHGWVSRSDNEADFPMVTKAVDMMVEYIKEHLFK